MLVADGVGGSAPSHGALVGALVGPELGVAGAGVGPGIGPSGVQCHIRGPYEGGLGSALGVMGGASIRVGGLRVLELPPCRSQHH